MTIQSYDLARRHGSGVSQFVEKHAKTGIKFVQSFEKGVRLDPSAKQGIQACCEDPQFTTALVSSTGYMVTRSSLNQEVKRFEFSKHQSPDRLCIIDEHSKCFIYDLSVVT